MYPSLIVGFLILLIPTTSIAQARRVATLEAAGHTAHERTDVHGEDSATIAALRPRARQGDAEAALLLGRMHAEGRGVPASRAAGLAELRRAALTAQPDALAYIGFRFLFEDSFPGYDPAEARRWFAAAADRGSAQGAFGLGLLHKHGRGVPQSDSVAAAWFRRASDGGFAPAALMLATLHDDPASSLFDAPAADSAYEALRRDGHDALIRAWADAYDGGAREWYPVPVDHPEAARLRQRALRVIQRGEVADAVASRP